MHKIRITFPIVFAWFLIITNVVAFFMAINPIVAIFSAALAAWFVTPIEIEVSS